ncbi:MAG TPA: DUF3147 family protein [Ramlibacter sp.]|nr:DUF3147 family protein [Ramlibacter sp.]
MGQFALKVLVSALVVVAVAEIAKRSTAWAAALASLPLTSLLAFAWLHVDGTEPERIARLATDILWMVLPSLVLFILLPVLLRAGLAFWLSLFLACAATALAYGGVLLVLDRVRGQG